jgi:hypothetical protein
MRGLLGNGLYVGGASPIGPDGKPLDPLNPTPAQLAEFDKRIPSVPVSSANSKGRVLPGTPVAPPVSPSPLQIGPDGKPMDPLNPTPEQWKAFEARLPTSITQPSTSMEAADPNKLFLDDATSRIDAIYDGMDLGKYFTYSPDAGAKAAMEQAVKSVSNQGAIAKAAIDNAYAQGIITSNEAAAAAQQARYAQAQMLGQLFQQGGAAVEKMNANNQNSYNNIYGNVGRLGEDNGAASDMAQMLYATSPVEAQYASQLGDIGNSQMLDLGKLLIASQGADQSRLGQALAQENSRIQMQYAKEEQARRDSVEASRRQAEMAREQAKADALGSLLNTQLKTEYENGIGMDQKMKGQAKVDAYNNGGSGGFVKPTTSITSVIGSNGSVPINFSGPGLQTRLDGALAAGNAQPTADAKRNTYYLSLLDAFGQEGADAIVAQAGWSPYEIYKG